MNIINLTPHDIVLRGANGKDAVIPPSGTVARVDSRQGIEYQIEGVPVPCLTAPVWGEVFGIPAERSDNTIYLVSALVAGRINRADVFAPGTGPRDGAIRDESGKIVAVTRLICSGC